MREFKTTLVDRRRFEARQEALVGTARCISYNLPDVRRAVSQCVEELPDLQELLASAGTVLLKPNLVSARRGPDACVNTHPHVVQAIAELLIQEFRCETAIGDSCGTLTDGSTARAIAVSGMDEVAKAVGASIYNVDAQPRDTVHFEQGRIYHDIPLPSNLDQFDLIISVPKMKTHHLTYITGAVKNMLGLVPGGAKKKAHLMAPRPREFAALLCDLYMLVRPGAAFIDGIVSMQGRGPSNGDPRHTELIAASCDPVALDTFCAQVMGFEPRRIPLLAQCQARGAGISAPASITVRGEPAEAFAPRGFAKPPTYADGLLLRIIPRWLFRWVFGALVARYATIDQEKCKRCGECALNCPSHAISRDSVTGCYRVNRDECISCYCCDEVCPHDAISIQPGLLKRILRGILRRQARRADV